MFHYYPAAVPPHPLDVLNSLADAAFDVSDHLRTV
jgi:hypothetical protein